MKGLLADAEKARERETANRLQKAIEGLATETVRHSVMSKVFADKMRTETKVIGSRAFAVIPVVTSWDDAARQCQEMRGSIACIDSTEVNAFVARQLDATDSAWIGATVDDAGTWSWPDGRKTDYTNWQQTLRAGSTAATLSGSGKWGATRREEGRWFICEWAVAQRGTE